MHLEEFMHLEVDVMFKRPASFKPETVCQNILFFRFSNEMKCFHSLAHSLTLYPNGAQNILCIHSPTAGNGNNTLIPFPFWLDTLFMELVASNELNALYSIPLHFKVILFKPKNKRRDS